VTVPSDDRVVMRLCIEGALIHGTPWGGTAEIACNCHTPLSAMRLLKQPPEHSLQPFSMKEVAVLLPPRVCLPFWDAALLKLALGPPRGYCQPGSGQAFLIHGHIRPA
jgi:hypothetical protein